MSTENTKYSLHIKQKDGMLYTQLVHINALY